MEVIKYKNEYKNEWDNFISKSKNSTFLFYRNYMDYHSDRFIDNSFMFYYKNKLIALLPANINNECLISHGGLTYGGLLTNQDISTSKVLNIFNSLKEYLQKSNIRKINYKTIPHIYHELPSEEDQYALFINNAQLIRRDVSSTISLANFACKSNKKSGARKAENNNVRIELSYELNDFFSIVNNGLREKYNVSAVHSPDEMKMLMSKFPENIKLWGAFKKDKIVAGAIVFETKKVVHTQYLSNSEEGKFLRAMDLLVISLLDYYSDKKQWFDFGISTEDSGKYLNTNLIKLKEEFGASAINYDTYQWTLN
jgi:hypothetical protein